MVFPPRPGTISIPAVVAGNILQNDDTSVSVNDAGLDGHIVMKTQNEIAMIVNPDQSISVGTELIESKFTINSTTTTQPLLRLSYQDAFFLDGSISTNGNITFDPHCDNLTLDPDLEVGFKKNFNIINHNGSTRGLKLNGSLVTATASELNYVDVTPGSATATKAMVLDISKNITGINSLSATTLSGTLTAGPQHNITELDTVNIRTQLSLNGVAFNLTPTAMSYLDILTTGVASPNKALVVDSFRNIININQLTASTITGILTPGAQPNITSLSALANLNVNGTSTFGDMLTITNASGNNLRVAYDVSNYGDINANASGILQLNSTGGMVSVQNTSNFRVSSHNGVASGLILGNQLVLATGAQLNYNSVTPGTASALKTLVLDSSKNITGINLLSATSLAGTLTNGIQPNIAEVNVLNISNHNGSSQGLALAGILITATAQELNYNDTTIGSAQANKSLVVDASRNIANINTITATSVVATIATTYQPNINQVDTLRVTSHNGSSLGLTLGSTLVLSTADQLNYNVVIPGIATALKTIVLDTNKSVSGITSLSATTLVGTLASGAQPNISSVNTLNIINHNGSTTGLSLNGILVTSTASQLNRVNVTPGTSDFLKALVLDSNKNISGINQLSASTLSGIISTAAQINIRILRSIDIEDHDGLTLGLSLGGTLIQATADQINTLTINPGVAQASKALILNSAREITNIALINATNVYGIIRTAIQPFITSVSLLDISAHDGVTQGLSLGGTLITVSSAQLNKLNVVGGTASASKVLVLDSASSISGINSLSASTLTGTLLTAAQPNISMVNTLNVSSHNGSSVGLSLGGTLVIATANQINQLATTPGTGVAGKAMILDSTGNFVGVNVFGATDISGTLITQAQPYISSVDVLNISNHDGSQGLRLGGILVSATANQLNYNVVVPGTATSGRSLVTNDSNSISGINQISANRITATQLALTGVLSNFNTGGVIIKSYSSTNLTGRVIDIQLLSSLTFINFQPGGLTNLYSCEIYGYVRPSYSELYTFFVSCSDRVRMWVNDVLILHSWTLVADYQSSNTIFLNSNQWTKIYIQFQVDAISTPFMNIQWSSANTLRANIPTNALAWDSNQPSNTSNHSSQNSISIYNTSTAASNYASITVDTSGDLTIDASGNDIKLGTNDNFNIQSHDGVSSGLYLGGTLVQPTAYEINYLKVNPGSTTASKALVVDASKSLVGINSFSATSITCTNLVASAFTISNLALSGPLNNYNTGSLLVRQFSGPDVSGRIVSVDLVSDLQLFNYDPRGLINNYSLDIIGYIKPIYTEAYTFYATANDRVRIFINNVLVLNIWDSNSGLEYTSIPISLTANQWIPIYIQYQNIIDTSSLIVKWSSVTLTKSLIPVNSMAWDNSFVKVPLPSVAADSMLVFSSQSGLTSVQSGGMNIDNIGNLYLSTQSTLINTATNHSFNVATHNGTKGLMLSGTLVLASANEINRLAGITPGTASASKVLSLDINSSISGVNSFTATNLFGTIGTAAQPFITSLGTLASTLSTSSDVVIGSSTLLRMSTSGSTAFVSSSTSTTTDSSADLFIGNYGATTSTSSRKFIIKSTGFVGIQTNTPNRALSINAEGASYAIRLVNNNASGAETNYVDLGCDSSGNYVIAPTGTTTSLLSNLLLGKTNQASITNTAGVLNISANSVQIGNASGTTMPLEVGSATFTLSGSVGFLNSSGATGIFNTAPSTYSIRTASSIIVNGTVCVTSDLRLKEKVEELDIDRCKNFIKNTRPVSFAYKQDREKTHLGLIAQEIIQSDFKELVQLVPQADVPAERCMGVSSPQDAVFNVAYIEVIPILMQTIKDLYNQNEELRNKLDQLYTRLDQHGL